MVLIVRSNSRLLLPFFLGEPSNLACFQCKVDCIRTALKHWIWLILSNFPLNLVLLDLQIILGLQMCVLAPPVFLYSIENIFNEIFFNLFFASQCKDSRIGIEIEIKWSNQGWAELLTQLNDYIEGRGMWILLQEVCK